MDLSWCPVCDKQNFAIESLYCSEACRKKDALSTLNEESTYKFPRCSSQKPYQSPYNSPYNSPFISPYTSPYTSPHNSPLNSPESSPIISPTNMITMMMDYDFQSINTLSSSPSELLFYGLTPSISVTNRTNFFFNNPADSSMSILKARNKVSRKKKYL